MEDPQRRAWEGGEVVFLPLWPARNQDGSLQAGVPFASLMRSKQTWTLANRDEETTQRTELNPEKMDPVVRAQLSESMYC